MERQANAAGLSAALDQWSKFLSHTLATRLDPDDFASFAPLLYSKHRLPQVAIADLFLRPIPDSQSSLDPRIPQYLQSLLKLDLVDSSSVLRALYKYSSSQAQSQSNLAGSTTAANGHTHESQKKKTPRWAHSYPAEETIFYRLAKTVGQGDGVKSNVQAAQVLIVLSKWITLFADAATAFSGDAFGTIQTMRAKEDMESARSAFIVLLLGVCENPHALDALSKPSAKEIRKQLSTSLEAFLPTILPSSAEVASRLELFRTQTLAGFDPADSKEKDQVEADMNGLLDLMGSENLQIPDIPSINTRAGLYIYLNAALVAHPLMDDHALYSYLHSRFQGDLQQTAIQLILASFDVLANAVFRNEGAKDGQLLKSYVVNKVPLILRYLVSTSTMYPLNAEFCITQALGQVDTNVFPTLSNMFDISNTSSSFQDSVRQDFCFSCQLHGLLSESATETLLGEITYQSLPDEGRYVKETLVQDCLEDPERIQKLIGELEGMNGNVGAAAQAIVEVMSTLCRNKETMALKQLCSQLASKPLSLDILLLFDKPSRILYPLCELLDNWRYDDDQGEYQAVYEEFSSVLHLLLAFVHRYGLSPADLGVRSSDSFVGALLGRGNPSKPLQELNEQEQAHIGSWIHGLFDGDGGGLGDELMSSCPPQDFYLLIPTLFHQIVLALIVGQLSEDALKGGLDYLVDTFLLPALIPAFLFLSTHLWATNEIEQKAILRVFQLIVRPKSGEASASLASVLNIVAKPLEQSLRTYQRQHPKSQDVEPLLRALHENLPLSRRTGASDHNELESWTSGSLASSIRHTVQNFVTWAQHPTINGMPTSYTHRQMLVGQKILGAKPVLVILLDEIKSQTEAGNASVAYDIATALICAPDVSSDVFLSTQMVPDETGNFPPPPQRRLTLRDALRAEADDWKRINKQDPVTAEMVVRLHRRVEAQMLQLAPPPPDLLPPTLELGGDALDKALAAAAAVGADAADAMTLDTTGLDGVGDLGLGGADLGLVSATNSAGGLDLSGDDIFGSVTGGADFNTDLDFSSWDL